ncbi:helicase C-terminal domain-containing protein [Haloactinopolyspora alba]|uniref:helicase C-terminal domain-containing protein n=1 Tax=Haloactinopolyspora alba TaxID=648780 RepID=UPI00197ADD02|nr:helicase C-terminal domain-containing protein [Haloactinopolyspora alba]
MTGNDSAPRSLADDLRARADDELAALLRSRPDLLVPVPVDVAQLATRATTRASAQRAVDRLDRFTLQVVDALMVASAPATPSAVQALLGTASAPVAEAVARLREQALLWGPDDDLRLPRVVHEIIGPHPAGLGPPAEQALLALSPNRLVAVMRGLGLTPGGDHATNAHTVAGRLADGPTVDALIETLPEDARSALYALVPGPPTGRIDGAMREVTRDSARSAIDHLLATGLFVPVDDATVVLPREVALHLRGGVVHADVHTGAPVPSTTERAPDTVDRTAGAGAFDIVRKIELLLDTWATAPPPVLRTGGLGVRDLRRLPDLLDTDEAGAGLVAELAYAAGLLAPSNDVDDNDVWLPTADYDTWRRDEHAHRWASLTRTWLDTSRVAGLIGTRDDRDRPVAPLGAELDRPVAPELRRLVLDELAALPAGAAPELTGVLTSAQWRRPRRGGRIRDEMVRWFLREAEMLGVTGMGALASFVRPLLDRNDEKAVDAAAEAAQACLPEPLDHILLQADLTAVAPGPLRPDLERELALISDVESRGGASVHRFSDASLRRALDAGYSADDVHTFLSTVSRTPVPQPLTYLVDDVARRHGHLRVGSASSFVRCDDETVLTEILADSRAAGLGARRLAPTVLVSSLTANLLLDRLRRMGFSPVAEAADGSLVVGRAEVRRAAARPAPQPLVTEHAAPEETLLGAAVRAVRAGERSREERPAAAAPGNLGRTGPGQTLADLREALQAANTVWIGYVDQHGATTERLVDPARLEGGWLSAFDHRSGEVRTFAVHRISGVSPVDAA